MGFEPDLFRSAAPATCLDCAASTYRSVSLSRWFSRLLSAAMGGGEQWSCRGGSGERSVWTFTVTSAWSRSVRRAGCASVLGRGAEHARGLVGVRAEPEGVRSGGAGGDGQLLGGCADPRAARRPGGRGQPGRHGDLERAREDRPAGRAHAGEVVVVGGA